jgi:hypothetical protein
MQITTNRYPDKDKFCPLMTRDLKKPILCDTDCKLYNSIYKACTHEVVAKILDNSKDHIEALYQNIKP